MKLNEVLEVITFTGVKGVKLYKDKITLDENILFVGDFNTLWNDNEYLQCDVFQIITHSYDDYTIIVLE